MERGALSLLTFFGQAKKVRGSLCKHSNQKRIQEKASQETPNLALIAKTSRPANFLKHAPRLIKRPINQ